VKTWTTVNGQKIPYKNLETSHLKNIIKYIERRAGEGIDIIVTNGCTYGPYCDVETIYDDEVYEYYDYKELKKELAKRLETK